MDSRNKILASIARSQPEARPLPVLPHFEVAPADLKEKFTALAVQIGSSVFEVNDMQEVEQILKAAFSKASRIVSTLPESDYFIEAGQLKAMLPHSFEDIDLLLIGAQFGVAENSALWITQDNLVQRVLPFITQHLAVLLHKKDIVPNMHEAYQRIGDAAYDYAAFIAGPSKTADIEQSLVLGAHGPRSLTIFLI
jgi:L-lactate dehydrogenase complex protein LldG